MPTLAVSQGEGRVEGLQELLFAARWQAEYRWPLCPFVDDKVIWCVECHPDKGVLNRFSFDNEGELDHEFFSRTSLSKC